MGRRQRNKSRWIDEVRTKPSPPPAIFSGRERQRLVGKLARVMSVWISSAFEHEGDMRATIRSNLCRQGHGWGTADHESTSLIAEALKLNGAVRPNWEEGQHEYTRIDGFCIQCGGPVELGQTTKRGRYCSVKCASNARLKWQGEGQVMTGASARDALLNIKREGFDTFECLVCNRSFLPYTLDHIQEVGRKYCSSACIGIAKRSLEMKPCQQCRTMFLPTQSSKIYCGITCRNKAMVIHTVRECIECGETFKPRSHEQTLCGRTCRDNKQRQRTLSNCQRCSTAFFPKLESTQFCSRLCYDEELKEQRSRVICAWCGVPFEAKRKTSRFCSDSHRAMDGHQRKKAHLKRPIDNVIYLTAGDFDRLFKGRSAAAETTDQLFDRLFG